MTTENINITTQAGTTADRIVYLIIKIVGVILALAILAGAAFLLLLWLALRNMQITF